MHINCTHEYEDFEIGVSWLNTPGKPLALPKISNATTILNPAKQLPIKINDFPQEKFHNLQRVIDATKRLIRLRNS